MLLRVATKTNVVRRPLDRICSTSPTVNGSGGRPRRSIALQLNLFLTLSPLSGHSGVYQPNDPIPSREPHLQSSRDQEIIRSAPSQNIDPTRYGEGSGYMFLINYCSFFHFQTEDL